jgi:hypothetical protein
MAPCQPPSPGARGPARTAAPLHPPVPHPPLQSRTPSCADGSAGCKHEARPPGSRAPAAAPAGRRVPGDRGVARAAPPAGPHMCALWAAMPPLMPGCGLWRTWMRVRTPTREVSEPMHPPQRLPARGMAVMCSPPVVALGAPVGLDAPSQLLHHCTGSPHLQRGPPRALEGPVGRLLPGDDWAASPPASPSSKETSRDSPTLRHLFATNPPSQLAS